ncbi:MAG: hypothetical protein QOD75_882 [Blastocatellia bacterium]|jgi:uncharacterized heparinase superfamily protein|nr:hypothetical protein [Blastocatellia bacterium]
MLYYDTVRHLKPGQIAGRLQAMAKDRMRRPRPVTLPPSLNGSLNPRTPFLYHDPWNGREQLCDGRFRFLNHEEHLGWPVNWRAAETLPLLWQFNLHYFHYLHLLDGAEREEICKDWIRANALGSKPAWHPYPTSLRIVNWCKANLKSGEVQESIYQQAAFLFRNQETYHPGNHLLENARALVFAGTYFGEQGEAPRWLERGLEIYERETPAQVLDDGGYFERSPMYHALVLEGYLDVMNLHGNSHEAVPLIDAAKRMANFLITVTHPSGQLALFNDSTQEIAPPTADLLDYGQRLTGYQARKVTASSSGYFVDEAQDLYLIIDGGPIGPSFLPAHAHADIFSFELSVKQRPIVVDSGVCEYKAGEMRQYARSTRAHNTVTVDKLDQAECWGSFRVARRFDPKDVSFRTDAEGSRFAGTFDGYGKLIGDQVIHQRSIVSTKADRRIRVADRVSGTGKHLAESMLHLHPSVAVQRDGNRLTLKCEEVECLLTVERGEVAIEDGWYCPRFGVKERNTVIAISGGVPCELAYTISY